MKTHKPDSSGRIDFINALFLPDTPQVLCDEIFANEHEDAAFCRKVSGVEHRKRQGVLEKTDYGHALSRHPFPLIPVSTGVFPELQEDISGSRVSRDFGCEPFSDDGDPYKINQIIHDYLEKTC